MHGMIATSGRPDDKVFTLTEIRTTQTLDPLRFERHHLFVTENRLENGDLLRIFNSIASGEKIFECEIDLEVDKTSYQSFQRNTDRALWHSMFNLHLPAKLQKPDGTIIDGKLDPFSEQGMEGRVEWMLFDFKNNSYASLHSLEKGDLLTVFSHVMNGNIEWEGKVEITDQPDITGQKILLYGFDNDRVVFHGDVSERFSQTYINPKRDILDHFAIHHAPAQVIR